MNALPDYLIIGTQRGGTTSLYHYLTSHPQVLPPAGKELHFFDIQYDKGLAWYRSQFPLESKPGSITGEASPYYLFHPLVPERVRKTVPDARLIALLRNPVDRAYSHYQMAVRLKAETLSFEEALEREDERLEGEIERIRNGHYYSYNHQFYSYRSRGLYAEQLEEWRRHFPNEQLLILRSEDFYGDPSTALAHVTDFLGLSRLDAFDATPLNDGVYSPMGEATRKRLADYFEPHNRRLEDFLGMSMGWE